MKPSLPAPKTYQDLMVVTGRSREVVKQAIRTGQLPGYLVGSRYVVPAEAFDAFCAGTWVPLPMPKPEPIRPLPLPERMVARRKSA